MALDATPAGANANSYITVADADVYFASRLGSDAWDDALDQEESLLHACQVLDGYEYIGVPSTDTQALKWPRYLNDAHDFIETRDGKPLPVVTNPVPIRKAQCEIALYLLQHGGTAVSSGSAIDTLKIGSFAEVKYQAASSSTSTTGGTDESGLPLEAARLLAGLRLIPLFA